MFSVTSVSCYVTIASRYETRPSMYIRGLIPQNLSRQFHLISEHYKDNSTIKVQLKYRQSKKFFALSLSDILLILLINVKMSTIFGILTLMSGLKFLLS